MSETPKQTVGRVVQLYGLPGPVTSSDECEAAQLAVLCEIRDELRGIRNEMQQRQPSLPPAVQPAPESKSEPPPFPSQASAMGRKRK